MSQQDLGLDRQYRHRTPQQLELADFHGALPPGVLPTTVRVLESEGNLLFVKHYEQKDKKIPKAHLRVWRALVKMGSWVDGPGEVTVLAVWGRHGTTLRYLQKLSRDGESKIDLADDDTIKSAIETWWRRSKRG